jgi:hypothetical protein
MKTSITLDEFQESLNLSTSLNSEATDVSSGKSSFWKRLFGGGTQATSKTIEKGPADPEPAAISLGASEPAKLASPDACAPTQLAEVLIEVELEIPITPSETSAAQESVASASGNDSTIDEDGGTPLHMAASLGQAEPAAQLLAQGADITATDHHGRTPLHRAALCGSKEVAELLLAHGANVNARNAFGLAPLHTAARYGMKDLADLLIGCAADVNISDNFGDTPLRCAIERGENEVAELLRQNGAEESISIEQAPVIEQAPPGALIQSVVIAMPRETETLTECESKGETPHPAEEMSRKEIQSRRLTRKKAAREAKRARALAREFPTAIAA